MTYTTIEQANKVLVEIVVALGEYHHESVPLAYSIEELVRGYKSQLEAKEMFKREVVRLEQERDLLAAVPNPWQPIESAPKDDRDNIVFWLPESGRYVTGHSCWWMTHSECWSTDDAPTHWMHLPCPTERRNKMTDRDMKIAEAVRDVCKEVAHDWAMAYVEIDTAPTAMPIGKCISKYVDLPTIIASVEPAEPEFTAEEVVMAEAPWSYVAPAEPVNARLLAALKLAHDMFIANDLSLPHTFAVISEAIAAAEKETGK